MRFNECHREGLQWLLGLDDDEDIFDFAMPGFGAGGSGAGGGSPAQITNSEIKQHVRKTGVGAAVQDWFREITTCNVEVRDRTGSRLDMRNTVRRLAGDTTVDDVFERSETIDLGDRTVGIALDMSSSMRKGELDAKSAVGALCHTSQEIGDTIVLISYQGGTKTTVLTGPRERWQWSDLNETSPSGGTPTSTGILKTAELMDRTNTAESILFVVTDGNPRSVQESKTAVKDARDQGHGVIGVGFGNVDEPKLSRIFGHNGYVHTRLEELADELVKAYRYHIDQSFNIDITKFVVKSVNLTL